MLMVLFSRIEYFQLPIFSRIERGGGVNFTSCGTEKKSGPLSILIFFSICLSLSPCLRLFLSQCLCLSY